MSYKSVKEMTEDELITHLEDEHNYALAHRWPKQGPQRKLHDREVFETYHDCFLHKAPRKAGHQHDSYQWTGWKETDMAGRTPWEQRTPCICLEPPRHSPDCTGKLGVMTAVGNRGKSAQQQLWEKLDEQMDILKGKADQEAYGKAFAYATALALILDPVKPNIDLIRKQAVERWKERQEDAE